MGKKSYLRFVDMCVFISKHKVLYFILNHTWGLIYTLLGYIVFLILRPFSKVHKYNYIHYLKVPFGSGWGFEMGTLFVVSKDITEEDGMMLGHEFGHTCQNALLGPLFIFLVAIPSAIRFWYREHLYNKGITPKTGYDDIWFEGSATYIGARYFLESRD